MIQGIFLNFGILESLGTARVSWISQILGLRAVSATGL